MPWHEPRGAGRHKHLRHFFDQILPTRDVGEITTGTDSIHAVEAVQSILRLIRNRQVTQAWPPCCCFGEESGSD
jgi:hypothetical protein